MRRLVFLPLAGLALAAVGCGGSGGPEALVESSYQSAVIPGVSAPPPPGANGAGGKGKSGARVGLQRTNGPLPPPPQG